MANTLVGFEDIGDLPDALDIEDSVLDMAVASVRGEAGWHIAPQVTETLTADSYGGTLLPLPTRRIVAVTAVRDVTTGSLVLTGWQRMSGGLYRRTGWPVGVLEVDLTHGYATTPVDLFPVVVARARDLASDRVPGLSQRSVTKGPFSESETYRTDVRVTSDPVVARYAVPAGVA